MWAGDVAGGDNVINMIDIMYISKYFNSSHMDINYEADCDLNKDDAINLADIMIAARHFNTTSLSYN